MKYQTPELRALLASGSFVRADLWTITLNGGGVVRLTGADQTINWNGNNYLKGPGIDRGDIKSKRGVQVATLDMTITADQGDLISGSALIPFVSRHGLDGANIRLESVYAASWSDTWVGTMIDFSGRVTSVKSIQGGLVGLTVSSWLVLLNASSPRNLYQAGCLRVLYDTSCGVDPSTHNATGSLSSGGLSSFSTSVTGAATLYAQGRIVFTSGPNSGVSRTVKSFDAAGNVSLVTGLPVEANAGDTFKVYQGCDLSKATCLTKFNNLLRFKATPFVPVPTTVMGSTVTTTTSGGKG